MTPDTPSAATLTRTIRGLLAFSSLLQTWSGMYLTYDQSADMVGSCAGLFVTVVGILMLSAVVTGSLPLMALLQVILASMQLVICLLIGISLYSQMNDQLLMAIYFSSLLFLLLQTILVREYLSLNFVQYNNSRDGYTDLESV